MLGWDAWRRAEMGHFSSLYRGKVGGCYLRGIDTGGFVKEHGVHGGCNTAIKRADGWCLILGSIKRVMPECVVRRLESAGRKVMASRCGSEMKLELWCSLLSQHQHHGLLRVTIFAARLIASGLVAAQKSTVNARAPAACSRNDGALQVLSHSPDAKSSGYEP